MTSIDAVFTAAIAEMKREIIAEHRKALAAVHADLLARTYEPLGPWMTQLQAAEYCNVSDRTIRDAVAAGRLAAGGHGSKPLFCRKWLDEYIGGEEPAESAEPTPLHPTRGRAA